MHNRRRRAWCAASWLVNVAQITGHNPRARSLHHLSGNRPVTDMLYRFASSVYLPGTRLRVCCVAFLDVLLSTPASSPRYRPGHPAEGWVVHLECKSVLHVTG